MVYSSLVFAVFHVEIIGSFIFAVVLSMIFVNTRSLIGPILVHMSNNGIVFLMIVLSDSTFSGDLQTATTVEEFRAAWWLALLGAAIGIPWLLYFCRGLSSPVFAK